MRRTSSSNDRSPCHTTRRLLLIIADGVRPDLFNSVIDHGDAPTLARLRDKGGCHTITSSFPSVTGPAYVPLLTGRHPGRAGLPGIRWFDRTRSLKWSIASARSYVGLDIWRMDGDLSPNSPTLLELARPSLSAMSILARGASHGQIGRSLTWMARGSLPHFSGSPNGWRSVETLAIEHFLKQFAEVQPRFSVLAVTSPDKFSHRFGAFDDHVRDSVIEIDRAATSALSIAHSQQWDHGLSIWIVGDHGHESVDMHDDLHGWLTQKYKVLAHPRVVVRKPEIALMVSGNAMAHIYLDPEVYERRWWPVLESHWSSLLEDLVLRESVDLAITGESTHVAQVHNQYRGSARVVHHEAECFEDERWSYIPINGGDPLQLGGVQNNLDASAAWEITQHTPYPDSIVQLSLLVHAEGSGDILLSANPLWDFRARFEPIPHVSTHGALRKAQIQTPLLLDCTPLQKPQRTTDVAISALDLLGIAPPVNLEGRSFLRL